MSIVGYKHMPRRQTHAALKGEVMPMLDILSDAQLGRPETAGFGLSCNALIKSDYLCKQRVSLGVWKRWALAGKGVVDATF